jgi:drug/metabolite transporter superfamily protein YnfA
MPVPVAVFLLVAAVLEVGGDAVIRRGLRGGGLALVVTGAVVLGGYGVVVNLVPWEFSRLLGVYVGAFAAVSVLCGRFVFDESVPVSTWLGLLLVVAGGLVIQLGPRLKW